MTMLRLMDKKATRIISLTGEPSSMSRNSNSDYMPTDYFSRQALEFSFRLLHVQHPLLAHAIKNTMDTIKIAPFQELHGSYTGEMLRNTELLHSLKAHTVGKIVSALTDIGHKSLQRKDLPPEQMRMLRDLIEDWVLLTEWVLEHTSPDEHDRTCYQ